ncbi:hypothetical protein Trydic_g11702 [Trypoxylus dichotomus]
MLAQNLTPRLIAELGMSMDSVYIIVCESVDKICFRFAPYMLTNDRKVRQIETSEDYIILYDQDPFFSQIIVTDDETGCYRMVFEEFSVIQKRSPSVQNQDNY